MTLCRTIGHHFINVNGMWECVHCHFVSREITTVFPKEHTIH